MNKKILMTIPLLLMATTVLASGECWATTPKQWNNTIIYYNKTYDAGNYVICNGWKAKTVCQADGSWKVAAFGWSSTLSVCPENLPVCHYTVTGTDIRELPSGTVFSCGFTDFSTIPYTRYGTNGYCNKGVWAKYVTWDMIVNSPRISYISKTCAKL